MCFNSSKTQVVAISICGCPDILPRTLVEGRPLQLNKYFNILILYHYFVTLLYYYRRNDDDQRSTDQKDHEATETFIATNPPTFDGYYSEELYE